MADTATALNDPFLASLVQAISTENAQAVLGIGRSKLFEELGRRNLAAVKDGQRTFITVESIRAYQAKRSAAKFKAPPPPRVHELDKLHEQQRAKRAKRRAARRGKAVA